MKKLTAGIFSVLVGLVASNAADAAVASKGYVDKVAGANTTAISELSETVTANKTAAESALSTYSETTNKAISDMDTAYKAADQGLQSQIDTKQVALKVATDSPLKLDDQGNLSLEGIASDTELANLTQTVEGHTTTLTTLTGDANVDGSIAKQIANAVTALEAKDTDLNNAISANTAKFGEYTNTTDMNSAIATAKSEAVEAAKTETTTQVNALANGAVAENTAAISAINNAETGILKQAKDYADGVSANVTTLSDKVTENTNAITTLNANAQTAGSVDYKIAQLSADGGAIKAAATAAAAAQTTADGAVEVNTAQQTAIDANTANFANYTKTADLGMMALANVPETCSNPANYCVLTYNNTGFYWEVIERVDGESLPGGGTYSTQP